MARFLIYGNEGMATSLAWRLYNRENHDVRVFFPKGREHLEGMVPHVKTLEDGLAWVTRNGYIISEDEKDVSFLRKRKFKVYGGNAWIEKLENDRLMQMKIAEKCGVKISNYHVVENIQEAIRYIKQNPDQYALKQMGHAPKTWSFVGKAEDGSDLIDQLEWIAKQPDIGSHGKVQFMLQEVIDGIEFATAGWWMGNDWKRDDDGNIIIEINKEHKKEGDGDTGLTCGEAGTVVRFGVGHRKLFEQMVEPLTPLLRQFASDVCINIDANCGICVEDGKPVPYLFEWTPRQGYPISALQEYMMTTGAGDFFARMLDGEQGKAKFRPEWGVITVMGSGSYPQEVHHHEGSFKDQPVRIPQCETKWDDHLAPLYLRYDKQKKFWRVADYYEYILAVMHHDEDSLAANERCVKDMQKVDTRAPKYRHDIGKKFVEKELDKLKGWGYVD